MGLFFSRTHKPGRMKRMRVSIRKTFAFLLIFILAVLPGLGLGEILQLPIDFSPGMRPVDVYVQGMTTYDDPSIHVERKWGKNDQFGCTVYTMDITIANATQLRTESCNGGDNGFNSRSESATVPQMAKRVNAVVAMDGDSFAKRDGHDFVLRQGVLFRDSKETWHDLLLIDEDGDFHVILAASRDTEEANKPQSAFPSTPLTTDMLTQVDGRKIINGFEFGPCIVLNGQLVEAHPRSIVHPHKSQCWNPAQRICLCQIGPLQYRIVAVAKFGLSVQDFAKLVYSMGDVQTAYMFDGGEATQIAFLNTKINNTDAKNIRRVSDIIYFASAYQPD